MSISSPSPPIEEFLSTSMVDLVQKWTSNFKIHISQSIPKPNCIHESRSHSPHSSYSSTSIAATDSSLTIEGISDPIAATDSSIAATDSSSTSIAPHSTRSAAAFVFLSSIEGKHSSLQNLFFSFKVH
ncbi:hypothetical protein R6Q59_009344 [Mikania micrantha]